MIHGNIYYWSGVAGVPGGVVGESRPPQKKNVVGSNPPENG